MRKILSKLAIVLLLTAAVSSEATLVKSVGGDSLQAMLQRWQPRLGLSAWQIEAELVPAQSLGMLEEEVVEVANIHYNVGRHTAAIRVEQTNRNDVEEALLHELVHLKLAAWLPPSSVEEEQTVDAIAHALLSSRNIERLQ